MQTEQETFFARAQQARADADAATLDNVRDRCLRAESAWTQMALRAARTQESRAKLKAEKAAAAETGELTA